MIFFKFFIFILFSYLIGSIPNGVILSKIFLKKDPREHGSKNIGATNAARIGGIYFGIFVLILDVLKGYIPVVLSINYNLHPQLPLFAGFCAFLGHLYPVFLSFKGGKGVATAIGVFIALTPVAILIDSIVFFIVAFTWKIISLSSIVSAIFLPGIIKILIMFKIYNYDYTIVYLASIISIFILYKHKENIIRLIKKQEPKFGIKHNSSK
jgi:glycerol-3-phosphate acyltransferase PlsY